MMLKEIVANEARNLEEEMEKRLIQMRDAGSCFTASKNWNGKRGGFGGRKSLLVLGGDSNHCQLLLSAKLHRTAYEWTSKSESGAP